MSHLLGVMRLRTKAMQTKGNVPLIVEFSVADETAPYLVSSSSSVMWINQAHPGPSVKSAVRAVSVNDLYLEVIEAVSAMGRQQQWGNVQPLTHEGLAEAIAHINFYELGPLELLTPRAHPTTEPEPEDLLEEGGFEEGKKRVEPVDLMPPELRSLIEQTGLPFRPSSWVPAGTIVVVPRDRTFVGLVARVTPKTLAAVVHNAARGIAVVQGPAPNELAGSPPSEPLAD